ncbi:hypothetical protein F2Q69_00006895 [Brassica cretica]|uniref:Uncharacterized protein n=1 Tax=Brassica cretica TaxID=69181 RepID=A0A8S9P7J2_BRACR|nr:hypothetical protein F2Q69_00006895 [Brassica cretica]
MSDGRCRSTEDECLRFIMVSEYRLTGLVSGSTVVDRNRSMNRLGLQVGCDQMGFLGASLSIDLQAMSQLFHLGERMDDLASLKADLAELTSQLREEKDNVLAKEKEIKTLKLKVRNQDEAGSLAAAENISLRERLEQREEEVCDLR